MSTYAAPLRDMQFAIAGFAGLEGIAALPGCGEVNAELVEVVLTEAGKFAQGVLDPLNRVGDVEGARWQDGVVTAPPGFAEAYRRFTEGGWNGIGADPAYGGQGLPHCLSMPLQEMWNSANMAFCLCPMLTTGVQEALLHHGSQDLLDRYMARLVSGEWSGTMNLTEPQAGSDLSAVRSSATPEGDHYRIRGTKIYITWGEHDMAANIVHLVLARLPDAPEGVKGISLFVVPKFLPDAEGKPGARNDVRCVSIENKLGIHGSPTCVLAYGDGPGAIGYLVGEPHRGLEYMFTMMNHARLGVGMEGIALAERAYQHALEYARTRVQGRAIGQRSGDRVTIIHHPDVRRMLLTMKAQTEAMRALGYFAAGQLDRARRHSDAAQRARHQARLDLLTPVVKGWCTETAVEVASLGVQVHGGMGFIEETGAAQYLRDARISTIYEGTTGIQANDLIGRKVGAEKGETAFALIAEMRQLDAPLAAAGPACEAQRQALGAAVTALERATQWLVDHYRARPEAAAAVAVPYLKLFGAVAGGWLMARASLLAAQQLDQPGADRAFLKAKQATARFYLEHLLPQAAAHADTVTGGADAVLALDPAAF
ncbi:MAG: acyl-CoA dehydrogenase [Betaproteobacteria bacterium]|jgi:alkylation response protein AidB-like acyl-CoA dehydrogenase|nr:acyl-CoA dehydrogenase [Betaproteobacteria bacterium]